MGFFSWLFGGAPRVSAPGKVYTVGIVGESHRNADGTSRQAEIKRCSEGDFVELVPEPHNPHDSNAILVVSENGRGIGYISRDHNGWIGEKLVAGKISSARIHAIIGGGRGEKFGVLLAVRFL
jgi:hypothetical protein